MPAPSSWVNPATPECYCNVEILGQVHKSATIRLVLCPLHEHASNLYTALLAAIGIIESWANSDDRLGLPCMSPEAERIAWQQYLTTPKMKQLTNALAEARGSVTQSQPTVEETGTGSQEAD
jgi:hypothetical protein